MLTGLVNRKTELHRLRELAANPPNFVVLSGRRRIGKSYLLRVALDGPRVIALQAEQQPLAMQLSAFARECSRLVPGIGSLPFLSWRDAFEFLDAQARTGGPLVCILDEFQYLAYTDKSLESTIQVWWDRWDHENVPIMLVLSGSALSFMSGLLGGSRPLYGRSVYRPILQPLSYRDTQAFLHKDASPREVIERFAVLGGTPQYQSWGGSSSLKQIIETVILSPDSPLARDPNHLIREEDAIREPGPYFGTLEAIAEGHTTPTAIGGRLQMSSQLITTYLNRLEELAYVTKVEPLIPRDKGRARSYWKISDPYFRFWFRYVLPNRSRLYQGRIKEVTDEIERDLPAFTGLVFEDICRSWIGSTSPLGATAMQIGSWWSRKSDIEIDVVAIDKHLYTLVGSCKWTKNPVKESVLDDLHIARTALGPKAAKAELALFSKSGFSQEVKSRAKREQVHLITVEDLFSVSSTNHQEI